MTKEKVNKEKVREMFGYPDEGRRIEREREERMDGVNNVGEMIKRMHEAKEEKEAENDR